MLFYILLLYYFVCLIYIPEILSEGYVKLPRYVIEQDLKPAIFGSYSFDMLKGVFVLHKNDTTVDTSPYTYYSNLTSPPTHSDDSYRKNVGVTEIFKPINWWTHAKQFRNTSRDMLFNKKLNHTVTLNTRKLSM